MRTAMVCSRGESPTHHTGIMNNKSNKALAWLGLGLSACFFAGTLGNLANSDVPTAEDYERDYHGNMAAVTLVMALAVGIPSAAGLLRLNEKTNLH